MSLVSRPQRHRGRGRNGGVALLKVLLAAAGRDGESVAARAFKLLGLRLRRHLAAEGFSPAAGCVDGRSRSVGEHDLLVANGARVGDWRVARVRVGGWGALHSDA